AAKIAHLIAIDELETGTWFNQIETLQRAGDTRRSHFNSVCSFVRIRMFNPTFINSQLQKLNSRFNERIVGLLILSSTLNPMNSYKLFNIDHICNLVEKFYLLDFSEQERNLLKRQLQHYLLDVSHHRDMKNLSTIVELCKLVDTKKSKVYDLIDRLLRLILTFPVYTVTTELSFSAMKIVKTRFRNKMENEFLRDCMVVYMERELTKKLSVDTIINDFYSMKTRR
ncbi:LOW QUALITY PROTEIN: Dimer_Tnp_hAT domain-containing protein, partial [Cephalotus follicularis]